MVKKHSKEENVHHNQQHQSLDLENSQSSLFLCCNCCSSLSSLFSLRCLIVLLLSFVVLLSVIFWLFPHRSLSEYNADETVKLTESVQAYFRLKRPASEVIVYKGRIEKDLFKSIDYLQNTKVTILSLHQSVASNYTDVEFAVLLISTDCTIRKDLLRSSFVKLFAQRLNLNLTISSLGKPTSFQVLKFPGGITVDDPLLSDKPVSGVVEILFNFTLDYSISEIQDRLTQLKDRLEMFLRLETYENVHFKLTNEEGSTISSPVIVQAYVVSTMRNNIQQRLNHLAQIIQTSASDAKNLGLDYSVFGEVKSISFTTYLEGKFLDSASAFATPPTSCFPSLC